MELAKNLQQLGLTENQAKVYISCLQLGVDTVLNIAKIAELKRPTVYLILDELENLGLVSKTKKASKSLFKAETPEKLVTDLKIKTETANNLLPSLKAIYNLDPEKPNIKIADGVDGSVNWISGSSTGVITLNAANVTQQALSSSSNAVAWDASAKPNAYHLTTENTTFSAPSYYIEGAFI